MIERYQQLQWFKDIVNDFTFSALEENVNALLNKLNDAIPSVFKHMNFSPNLYFSNINVSFDATGYNKAINKAFNNFLMKSFTNGVNIPISNITNFMGFELKDFRGNQLYYRMSGLNLLFSSWNLYQNLQTENVGRAILHTASNVINTSILVDIFTSGVQLLASFSGQGIVVRAAQLVSSFISSTPIGWAVIASVAMGTVVNIAYNNDFFGFRTAVNYIGDELNNVLKDVGNAFESGYSSLKSVWGW